MVERQPLADRARRQPASCRGITTGPRGWQLRREDEVGDSNDMQPRIAARIAVARELLEVHVLRLAAPVL